MPHKHSNSGQMLIALIVIVLITLSFFMAGGVNFKKAKPLPANTELLSEKDLEPVPPFSKKDNLQLEPLNFCNRVEGDIAKCYPQDAGFCCQPMWAKVLCKNSKCVGIDTTNGDSEWINEYAKKAGMTACEWLENPVNYGGAGHAGFPVNEWCATESCNSIPDGFLCWGKPVILLYPEAPTLVDVEVKTAGEIYVSDPLYPSGGWKNVLANPDGSLVYQNKPYRELFYESRVKNYGTPATGLVFKTDELKTKLPQLLYKLGLNNNKNEIPEFMDFWLPKLESLNSKYMLVSLIEKEVKDKNDLVIVKPEPSTRIEIIVYFKPLGKLIPVTPLSIGPRPARRGFTMVEWGGTIDNN